MRSCNVWVSGRSLFPARLAPISHVNNRDVGDNLALHNVHSTRQGQTPDPDWTNPEGETTDSSKHKINTVLSLISAPCACKITSHLKCLEQVLSFPTVVSGWKPRVWLTYFTFLFKVVLGGCHRYFFGVKVKTVKLIGGTRFLASRSGLNVRTYSKLIFRLLLSLQSPAG